MAQMVGARAGGARSQASQAQCVYAAISRQAPAQGQLTASLRREERERAVIGSRFGRLTLLYPLVRSRIHLGGWWLCRCDCGNEIEARYSQLTSGRKKRCGFKNHKALIEREIKRAKRAAYMRRYRVAHPREPFRRVDKHRKYSREHARDKRGRGYLTDLEAEATRRGLTIWQLKDAVLRTVTEDKLFAALLDR